MHIRTKLNHARIKLTRRDGKAPKATRYQIKSRRRTRLIAFGSSSSAGTYFWSNWTHWPCPPSPSWTPTTPPPSSSLLRSSTGCCGCRHRRPSYSSRTPPPTTRRSPTGRPMTSQESCSSPSMDLKMVLPLVACLNGNRRLIFAYYILIH